MDRDSDRKLFEVTGVLALPLGRFNRLQEFFLLLALLALCDYLLPVLEGVEVFSSLFKGRCGIVSLHVLALDFQDDASDFSEEARSGSGEAEEAVNDG